MFNLACPDVIKLDVGPSPVLAGQVAQISVTDGAPSAITVFAFGLSGLGSLYNPFLNLVVDLDTPYLGGVALSDGLGSVLWTPAVPPGIAGLDIWVQAFQYMHKTETVKFTVQ